MYDLHSDLKQNYQKNEVDYMLYRFLTLVKKDFKLILRNRQTLFGSLALPFLIFFIFSFIFSDMMHKKPIIEPLRVALVDHENSTISRTLSSNIEGNETFSKFIQILPMNEVEARKEFSNNTLTGIVEIPEGFSRSLYHLENLSLTVTLNPNQPLKSSVLRNVLKSYGKFTSSIDTGIISILYYMEDLPLSDSQKDTFNENITLKLITTAMGRSSIFILNPYEDIPSSTSVEYFVIAILVIFLMYNGFTAGSHLLQEVRGSQAKRIVTSPTGYASIILGKNAAFLLFSIAQTALLIIPASLIFKLDFKANILWIIFFTISVIFFIISLGLFVSTLFKNEEALILSGNILIFMLGILGGSFIPLQLMPSFIQKLSMITPNYWVIKGYLYIINGRPGQLVLNTLAAFTILGIVLTVLSSLKLRLGRK